MRLIVEVDPVVRIERHEVDVVREAAPPGPEDGVEDLRCRDEARPHVEGVPGVFQLVCPSTKLLSFFDEGDVYTRGLETHRACEPAEAASYDDCTIVHEALRESAIPVPASMTLRAMEV